MPEATALKEEKELEAILAKVIDGLIREKYGIDLSDLARRLNEINGLIHSINEKMVTKETFSLEVKTLTTKIEGIDKRVDDWRDSTKTYFTVLGVIVAVAGILVPILLRFS